MDHQNTLSYIFLGIDGVLWSIDIEDILKLKNLLKRVLLDVVDWIYDIYFWTVREESRP